MAANRMLRTYTCGALFLLLCSAAESHFFVQSYTLPVPFTLYATGAGVALLLSFVAVAVLARAPQIEFTGFADRVKSVDPATASWRTLGQSVSLTLLLLCIVSGIFGTQDAFRNINMTMFWIVFLLAVPYAVAVFGDFYASINPWGTMVSIAETASGQSWNGRVQYPEWLGHFPALTLYMAVIGIELFAQLRPFGLSMALLCYSALMLAGAWLFGKRVWLSHAEVFGQLFKLLGLMSSRTSVALKVGGSRGRIPFAAILGFRAEDWGTALFILFMLSSTAFDGVHATVPWTTLYWKDIYPHISWVDSLGSAPGTNRYAVSTQAYHVWQWVCLVLSPFLYMALFILFVCASSAVARSAESVKELVFSFVPTLLPIALVYHLSHYYTVLLWQLPQLVQMVSDPLGLGWDLLGTAKVVVPPVVVDVGTIWHTQVSLIVGGHMVSVLLAHFEALRVFRSRREATLSQMPMLILMMIFTASGLWILSLPLTAN